MKRIFIFCAVLIATTVTVKAQDEPAATAGKWETSSTPALKISEFFFDNWSKTGNSQIDGTATFFGNYKYTHPKYIWDNIADLAYGYSWQDLEDGPKFFETRRKSNDKIDLTSSFSWKPFEKLPDWGANFTANLKTQFGHGYEYSGTGANQTETIVSSFFAPAYLTTALSFEYKRPTWSVSLSFLTGKTTFVCDDQLIHDSLFYGVIQKDDFDYTDPATYTHAYFALGSYVKAQYLKKDLLPKLDLYARAELFYDYNKSLFGNNMGWGTAAEMEANSKYTLAEGEEWADVAALKWFGRRLFETDLDLELKLDYRLSEHIAANFALNLKWDTDFSGMGRWNHWQVYQMAGVQVYFSWKTPKAK